MPRRKYFLRELLTGHFPFKDLSSFLSLIFVKDIVDAEEDPKKKATKRTNTRGHCRARIQALIIDQTENRDRGWQLQPAGRWGSPELVKYDPSSGFHSSHCRDSGVSSSTFIPSAFNSVFFLSYISLSPYVSKSVLPEERPVALCPDPCPHLDTSESKG